MIVTIQIDTEKPLSIKDLDLLHQFTGLNEGSHQASASTKVDFPTDVERAAAEESTPVKKAVAKKTTAAKKAAVKTAEPEDDDAVDFEALRAEAVSKASNLLADGKREVVTKALTFVGGGRVSEIADENLQEFIDAIDVA